MNQEIEKITDTTLDQHYHIAEATLEMMRGYHLKPSFENYAVWHEYCAQTNPDLTKTVEIIKSNNREIDEETSQYLYKKFFTFESEGAGFLKTAEKADDVLIELKTYLNSYNIETDSYGEALEKVSAELDDARSTEDIKSLVLGMSDSTKRIQLQNQILQKRLEKSQTEVDGLKKNLEDLKVEATTDGLTGLANRKYFNATLLKEMTSALESGKPLSLMMLDIDHFKRFNDTHGHTVGDQVIRLVAKILGTHAKGSGLPARYGGEEFSIIMPKIFAKDAFKLGDEIRIAMASKQIQNKKTGESLGKITLSIGVAEFEPGETVLNFINRADEALYAAKKGGRDQVKVAA